MDQRDLAPADAHVTRASSSESQQALTTFHASVSTHIAAIQTAARELLARDTDGSGPREIRLDIKVGPDSSEPRAQFDSVDCWDEDVICGKGPTGYIHCTVHVCMEVGPITVLPG